MNRRGIRDLRLLAEIVIAIVVGWLLLGWPLDRAISQADGTVQWIPYTRDVLASGADWQNHLYRFAVVGGSAMHDSGGTLPLLQLAAWLGLSATTTANLLTVFLQLCFAFFGVKTIDALATAWFDRKAPLAWPERVTAILVCAFSPALAWQFSMGHENLLVGLLPFHVALALAACARARTLSPTLVVAAALTMFMAASGLGAQMVLYGLVFGAPILVTLVVQSRPWNRLHTASVLVLVGGALLAMPRLAGMIAYARGADFARSDARDLTYSFGASHWRDWLASIPWTSDLASGASGELPVHERNIALGPWLVLIPLFRSSRDSRRLFIVVGATLLVTLLFACDVRPISSALTTIVPPLSSFRVPARAVLAIASLLAPLGLAAWFGQARDSTPLVRKHALAAILVAALVLLVGHGRVPLGRELVVWAIAIAAVVIARKWMQRVRPVHWHMATLVLGALAVCAFDERLPRQIPYDPIEQGPARLRAQVLETAPELSMPLARVDIVSPPRPYEMSLAFAAGLPAIDGAWYPTRRFLLLLSALRGQPVDSTTGVFKLGGTSMFPVLQQLYNVKYRLRIAEGALDPLPPTPGAAWFPSSVEMLSAPRDFGTVPDLRDRIGTIAYVVRGETRTAIPEHCAGARVDRVETDAIGQSARIAVSAEQPCLLVVATNIVESLHATADGKELALVPVDIALTGIIVPAGTTTITLGPRADVPAWSMVAALAGLLAIAGSLWLVLRFYRAGNLASSSSAGRESSGSNMHATR